MSDQESNTGNNSVSSDYMSDVNDFVPSPEHLTSQRDLQESCDVSTSSPDIQSNDDIQVPMVEPLLVEVLQDLNIHVDFDSDRRDELFAVVAPPGFAESVLLQPFRSGEVLTFDKLLVILELHRMSLELNSTELWTSVMDSRARFTTTTIDAKPVAVRDARIARGFTFAGAVGPSSSRVVKLSRDAAKVHAQVPAPVLEPQLLHGGISVRTVATQTRNMCAVKDGINLVDLPVAKTDVVITVNHKWPQPKLGPLDQALREARRYRDLSPNDERRIAANTAVAFALRDNRQRQYANPEVQRISDMQALVARSNLQSLPPVFRDVSVQVTHMTDAQTQTVHHDRKSFFNGQFISDSDVKYVAPKVGWFEPYTLNGRLVSRQAQFNHTMKLKARSFTVSKAQGKFIKPGPRVRVKPEFSVNILVERFMRSLNTRVDRTPALTVNDGVQAAAYMCVPHASITACQSLESVIPSPSSDAADEFNRRQ